LLRASLDRDAQAAAEQSLGAGRGDAVLLAVQPSSGDVLAVGIGRSTRHSAARSRAGPSELDLRGRQRRGALRDGLGVDAAVPCPPTATVDGARFRNFRGQARGSVAFRIDFAQSCNTAFVSLAGPLQMAGVAATVAAGRCVHRGWPPLVATLRKLMRAVVTAGTGTALSERPRRASRQERRLRTAAATRLPHPTRVRRPAWRPRSPSSSRAGAPAEPSPRRSPPGSSARWTAPRAGRGHRRFSARWTPRTGPAAKNPTHVVLPERFVPVPAQFLAR
jgi:hypothetical protein